MVMQSDYAAFLASKAPKAQAVGIEPGPMPAHLFDFQADCVRFALRQGRAMLAEDTGLGKTRQELEFLLQAGEASNGRSLLLTPLAVSRQIEREGLALGYPVRVIRSQDEARDGINICNYDRLGALDTIQFGAVSLDESSILKSFTGATTRALIASFAEHRFRLCATATPAPNDHMELGTHAEFLGVMRSQEMLSRWFINDTSTASQNWRLKGHAVNDFWDWVASWARCAETPADLGYDASRFVLPPLNVVKHKAIGEAKPIDGALFISDLSATNIHEVKRQTAGARADVVAGLVNSEPGESWVVWCDTDYEADALHKRIPDAIEVRGSHSPDKKEAGLAAFSDGSARVLISKPSVCGMGMNWQHCARMAFVGRSFSYESWYQAVRRCWRFGQVRPVDVHLIVAEGEEQIGRVIERKAAGHDTMRRAMAAAMIRARETRAETKIPYIPTHDARLPAWLTCAV
jgi:hypothetical protein